MFCLRQFKFRCIAIMTTFEELTTILIVSDINPKECYFITPKGEVVQTPEGNIGTFLEVAESHKCIAVLLPGGIWWRKGLGIRLMPNEVYTEFYGED